MNLRSKKHLRFAFRNWLYGIHLGSHIGIIDSILTNAVRTMMSEATMRSTSLIQTPLRESI